MTNLQIFWKFSWRSILVAMGYMTGLIVAGVISALLGKNYQQMPDQVFYWSSSPACSSPFFSDYSRRDLPFRVGSISSFGEA